MTIAYSYHRLALRSPAIVIALTLLPARPVAADSGPDIPADRLPPHFDAIVEARTREPLIETDHEVPLISLRDAVAWALRQHPRDREVAAQVALAEAKLDAARAESFPKVAFRYEHIWEDSHIAPGGVRDPLDLYNVMLIADVPLVHPRAWATWSEAKERVDVSEADAVAARRAIGLSAAKAWIAAASASHALAAEVESLRTARAHAEFVRRRVRAGSAAPLDEVRANKEVAAASALVERARAGRLRAQERLGLLIGERHPRDADLRDDRPLSSPLQGGDLPVPEEIAAQRALEAAEAETHNMYTDYLPSLHLELLGFHQNHPQPILPVTGTGYAAFLRLTVPLYDGEREARLHERRAEQRGAEAHLDDVTRTVAVEKRDAHSDVVRLKAALEETARAAELARSALDLSRERYESGAGTQLDVIYAIREARDAAIAVAAAEDVWRRAALELLAARGRFPSYEQLRAYRRDK